MDACETREEADAAACPYTGEDAYTNCHKAILISCGEEVRNNEIDDWERRRLNHLSRCQD